MIFFVVRAGALAGLQIRLRLSYDDLLEHLRCLVLGLLLLGCSSDNGDQKAPKLDGLVHSAVFDEDNLPVPDVEICVAGEPDIPCVHTDGLGIGDLPVPLDQALVLTYEKDGFITKRRQIFTSEDKATGLGIWGFQRRKWYQDAAAAFSGTADLDGKGLIALLATSSTDDVWIPTVAKEGVKFDVQPAQGTKDPGIKPMQVMLSSENKLVPCVKGSTCELGITGYLDVPEGKYRAIFQAPAQTCTPKAFACADGTPQCIELEVVKGQLTFGSMPCQ
ncbi:MAG: hypothetical protein IT375_36865 [Polyangiaceae bacterium]|nr:hypothetical protein [Polyangiaceae bacterium]